MKIVEIMPLFNGAHRNQETTSTRVPDGWAVIPEGVEIPETYPFVDLVVKDGKVVSMTARAVPEPEQEPEPEPTEAEQLRADIDFLAAMTGVTL